MKYSEIDKIIDAINIVQEKIFNQTEDDFIKLKLITDGFFVKVKFMYFEIWSYDRDTRKYNEKTNTFEPYEECFVREINKIIKNISRIKL